MSLPDVVAHIFREDPSEGEPGEPGQPGKPGTGGGGRGGQGGAGGRGGRGARATTAWNRHRALVGYLVLVAVVIVAGSLYQRHVNMRLRQNSERAAAVLVKSDAIACRRANVVAENQRAVLMALIPVIYDARYATSPRLAESARGQYPVLVAALRRAGPKPC